MSEQRRACFHVVFKILYVTVLKYILLKKRHITQQSGVADQK